jgi:hypothetical protein
MYESAIFTLSSRGGLFYTGSDLKLILKKTNSD